MFLSHPFPRVRVKEVSKRPAEGFGVVTLYLLLRGNATPEWCQPDLDSNVIIHNLIHIGHSKSWMSKDLPLSYCNPLIGRYMSIFSNTSPRSLTSFSSSYVESGALAVGQENPSQRFGQDRSSELPSLSCIFNQLSTRTQIIQYVDLTVEKKIL